MFDSYTTLGTLQPNQDAIHHRRAPTKVAGKAKHVDLQKPRYTKPSEQVGKHITDPCKMTAP